MAEELTEQQLEELFDELCRLRDELSLQHTGSADRSGTVELDQAAVGRISRVDALQQQQMAMAERRRMALRLEQVEAALEAFEDEEYGFCAKCGEPIGFRRLVARPESRFCVPCVEARERA